MNESENAQPEQDEILLLDKLQVLAKQYPDYYVRNAVKELGISTERAKQILERWESIGWYDYGISIMAGWLTEKGQVESL